MLATYDHMSPSPERDAFALAIDKVAGQRYATVARLYWYTDLDAAKAEARAVHKPILSLRMLGKLDEDLSCANSRLFRATLYANKGVSQFLRDHFVLHWSSERAVPRVTIDFGDGRVLERTTTGNSAHYVLDEDGHVLDVLPGLYAPVAFRRELTGSLALAKSVRGADDAHRLAAIVGHQQDVLKFDSTWQQKLAGSLVIGGQHRLLTKADLLSALARAQRATMSKAYIEVPDLRRMGMNVPMTDATDVAELVLAGQRMYGIGDLDKFVEPATSDTFGYALVPQQAAPPPPAPHVLDADSRALVERLHDAVPQELVASPAQLTAMYDRLEEHIVADTAQNQLTLRAQIARQIIFTKGRASFEDLNTWIYAEVFQTPRTDAWLGLMPRTDFTGLPGDGIAAR
jgi:hypothetical protein